VSRALILAFAVVAAVAATSTSAYASSEVVVQLRGGAVGARAPLAALRGPDGRLSTTRPATRRALAQIASEQRAATRALRRAAPGIVVTARLSYTLDALVLMAPTSSLSRLARVHDVEHVFRSSTFHIETDRVPTVVDATPLWNPTPAFPDGTRGQGERIGIIDDGIDITRPSFSGTGFAYPPGFPKGLRKGVNGKIIVARAFAPPDTGPREHTAFDPNGSDHGTHVAGIAAGDSGITAMVDGVRVPGLSGVAPDAYLGNYRVLTTPTPTFGLDGNGAEIARAIERAVADGMDVLNLSLGEPEVGPGDDLVEDAIAGAARAGVTTVVAAGNEGDEGGFGTVSSPGSAADAITVAAVTNDRIFGLPLTVQGHVGPPFAVVAGPVAIPDSWGTTGLGLRISAGCGSGGMAGDLLLVPLGAGCSAKAALAAANAAGVVGLVLVTTAQGDPRASDADPVVGAGVPTVVISRRMGADLSALAAQADGTLTVTIGNVVESLGSGNGGLTTTFSSKGPAPISLRLKPDVAAPGEGVLSSIPGGYAIWDGTSMASPGVAGAVALLRQRHPLWSPADLRSALALTARPAYANPARTIEALPLEVGSGLIDVAAADATPLLSPDASASFGLVAAPSQSTATVELHSSGSGSGTWTVSAPGLSAPATLDVPVLGSVPLPLSLAEKAGARIGNRQGYVILRQGDRSVRIRWWGYVQRPRLQASPVRAVSLGVVSGNTRTGTRLASHYAFPDRPSQLGLPASYPGREQVLSFRVPAAARNAGVRVISGAVDPQILLARNENRLAGETALNLVENPYLGRYGNRVPVSGMLLPRAGRYYISVETRPGSRPGPYRLRIWADDATPPRVRFVSRTLFGTESNLRLVVTDSQSGFDPSSIEVSVDGRPADRVHVSGANVTARLGKLSHGRHRVRISVADYQELKNSENADASPLPNTRVVQTSISVR
jgi:minor extracellular serine protease Vpr